MASDLLSVSECVQILEIVHENSLKSANVSHSGGLLNSVDRAKLTAAFQTLADLHPLYILKTWLITLEKPVKLEILWLLKKNYLLQISSYLYIFEKFHGDFVKDLVQLATATGNEKYAHQILKDVLYQLLCVNDSLPSLYKIYQSILDSFVKEIVKIVYSENIQKMCYYLEDLAKELDFLKSERERFCSSHLTELLSCDPRDILLFDVISAQMQYYEEHTLPVILKRFVSNIFQVFSCGEVFEKIFSVISGTGFNLWKVLSIVSLAARHYGEKVCLDILEERFSESTTDHNKHMVYVTFIFIRQVFLEDSSLFQKYARWFKNLRLNNSQFSFLFQCLDRIVPYEPALYLKIHINEFPNVPCRSMLQDYITLAKTRLMDLNESTEYLGIFHLSDKMGQKADLRKIIAHFVQTGEVAKLLIEASVFRRQYFNNVFLPYLLGSESEELEGKTKFIERLNEQGLIPSNRYQMWQRLLYNL